MELLVKYLDKVNHNVGKVASWSSSLMVWVICIDVFMRYVLDYSFIWIVELEIYFFAISFILCAGYAFQNDSHVRVDAFYSNWSEKRKAWVNLIGGIVFLLPWCYISISASWKYAYNSWLMKENSPQPGGLPALYIMKFILVAGFVLLMIQGIVSILKSIVTLRQSKSDMSQNENLN
ncbi:MAG: TRAP transporter small permease subunit [Bacteroidota bacterium]